MCVLCEAESTPGVQGVELEKRLPCERMLLTAWEQRHCCTLPEDMRQFYTSTDGFRLIWNYEYAGQFWGPIGFGAADFVPVYQLQRDPNMLTWKAKQHFEIYRLDFVQNDLN